MTTKELKVSKVCRSIASVIRWALIVIVMLVVLAGLFIFLGEGGEWVVIQTTGEQGVSTFQYFAAGILYSVILMCALGGAYLQYKIFDDIAKDARPFKMIHAKRINKIIYLMIAMFILELFANFIVAWPSIDATVDLGFIMSILVIKGIAVILESGCDLQEQVDTTL